MNVTEAELTAREYFYGVPGVFANCGFEVSNTHFIDGAYRVECRVHSLIKSKMVGYRMMVRDEKVISIEEVD